MSVTYELVKEIYEFENNQRISYGIVAYTPPSRENSSSTIVVSLHDVTSDKEKLSELVLLCNRLNLSTIHFKDIVEDFVTLQ